MLAFTDIMFTVPLATFALILNVASGTMAYGSWADVHFDFGRVELYPTVYWKMNIWMVAALQLTRWAAPFCSFVFFAFFGFAEEARRHYAVAFWCVCRPLAPIGSRISRLVLVLYPGHPYAYLLDRYIFPGNMLAVSTSQATLAVEVTTSTCKFDYKKDLEQGLSTSKSLDSCNEVPLTPSSEPLPLYESHPSYARAL
jgi:hypothetical protein